MNKAILKKFYVNGSAKTRKDLEKRFIKYENVFLISNGYSIIALNDNYDMENMEIKFGSCLIKNFNNFETNYHQEKDITLNVFNETKDHFDIDEYYSINMKLLNIIKGLIRANKVYLLTIDCNGRVPIIKMINEKTKEIAYLLLERNY